MRGRVATLFRVLRTSGVLAALGAMALAGREAGAQAAGPVLVFGGDVIFDAPIEYALRRSDLSADDPASYAVLFEDVAPALGAADLAIVNLETPVAVRTRSRTEEHAVPTFAAPAAFLGALAAAGVDVVGVANNHAYDQGIAGLAETLENARASGLTAFGAGPSAREAGAATTIRVGGHAIALLGFTEATNWRPEGGEASAPRVALFDEDRITRHVGAARASSAELVIVVLHWSDGRDPDRLPSTTMRRVAEVAAAAGADLVVGHGTHLPAGSEVLSVDGRAVPVLWSLGNLAAVMESEDGEVGLDTPSVRDALLARVHTEPDGSGRLRVRAIDALPFWIDVAHDGASRFVRPLDLDDEIAELVADACGSRCDERAAGYRLRRERGARVSIADARVPSSERSVSAARASAAEPPPAPPIVAPPPAVVSPPPPVAAAPPAVSSAPPAVAGETVEREPGRRRSTARIPADLAAGVELRITFPDGSATETAIDEAQLSAIVERLRADRDLYAEIIGHPSSAEPDRALATRRARRVRGIIAIRGPSRSHLDSHAGSVADHAYLELRIWR